jgi:hypothetical protein
MSADPLTMDLNAFHEFRMRVSTESKIDSGDTTTVLSRLRLFVSRAMALNDHAQLAERAWKERLMQVKVDVSAAMVGVQANAAGAERRASALSEQLEARESELRDTRKRLDEAAIQSARLNSTLADKEQQIEFLRTSESRNLTTAPNVVTRPSLRPVRCSNELWVHNEHSCETPQLHIRQLESQLAADREAMLAADRKYEALQDQVLPSSTV